MSINYVHDCNISKIIAVYPLTAVGVNIQKYLLPNFTRVQFTVPLIIILERLYTLTYS